MKKLLIALLVIAAVYAVGAVVLAVANGQAEGKVVSEQKQLLVDGDMEAADTSAWTSGGGATLSKVSGAAEDGDRILRVTRVGADGRALQTILSVGASYRVTGWARSDGSGIPTVKEPGISASWTGTASTDWQYFDVIFTAQTTQIFLSKSTSDGNYVEFDDVTVTEYIGKQTNAEEQLILDGDMEEAGTGDWLSWAAGGSTILSKENGAAVDGKKVLRVTNTTVAGAANQDNVITVGKTYRLTGWVRGDGLAKPVIGDGHRVSNVFIGTPSTSWQRVDEIYIATGDRVWLQKSNPTGNYAEFDDILVTEYTAPTTQNYVALFTDGDMEAADTSAWSELGDSTVTKESAVRDDGLLALRVTSSGSGSPGTHQDVFVVGQRYRMTGWTRTDSSRTVQIGDRSLAGGCASLPSTGASWTHFDCTFTAGHVGARLGFASTGASQWAEFDDVLAVEL